MAIFGHETSPGKVTLFTALAGAFFTILAFVATYDTVIPRASADDVTTAVTVLNTPPTWVVNAAEATESSSSTPTNAGTTLSFTATASDSSGDNYYLLICKTSGAPTANASAAPTCNGGSGNQWAVSGATASGAEATASTSTINTFPFENELNDWYGWVCDANTSLPRCNPTYTQGSAGNNSSPFVINHVPIFGTISNDGPANPGETVTWTTTSYDLDTDTVADTVQLFVCKSNDFNGTYCGAGGSWATSTLSASNAATTTTIVIPTQDRSYDAYVYIRDSHGLVATSTLQNSNSPFDVSNVAPVVTASEIDLLDQDEVGVLELDVAYSTSGPFFIDFEVVDDNGCENASAGDEITGAYAAVYRSGITQAACIDASHYDENNCYAATSTMFAPSHITCAQDVGSCLDKDDSAATWRCSFNLWYNADPTDVTTPYTAQNWLASVFVRDDNFATSTFTETTAGGNEVASFLAFDVSTTSINYGGLEPGSTTTPMVVTTDLDAIGNIGLDKDVYGDTMCPTWTTADSCDSNGYQTANDILVSQQRFATSSIAYDAALTYALTSSTSPAELLLRIPKTTATDTPETKDTYWGIAIPSSITTAGNYSGQNTITAKKSDPAFW